MKGLNIRSKMTAAVGAVFLSTACTTWADNTGAAVAQRCLPLTTIKRTKIVDNQNILFYTRHKKVYNNHLPHACIGLAVGNTFKYETSLSHLCNLDIITVLHQAGSGWTPGASCGLGLFEPTTDPEKPQQKK